MLEDFETRRERAREGVLERLRVISPWLTGVILAGVLGAGIIAAPKPADTRAYFESVAERIRGVPYTVGTWVGRDVEVVAAARTLLQPNAIVQRRYTRLDDGQWFDVIIVHCGDVTDMQGHYPPVCYPSAGWQIDKGTPVVAGLGGGGVPATEYVVTWPHDRAVSPMRIVNFFALPSEAAQFARDDTAMERAARSRASAELGVLQIQVLTPAGMDTGVREALLPEVWRVLEPVVNEVVGGPDADR